MNHLLKDLRVRHATLRVLASTCVTILAYCFGKQIRQVGRVVPALRQLACLGRLRISVPHDILLHLKNDFVHDRIV